MSDWDLISRPAQTSEWDAVSIPDRRKTDRRAAAAKQLEEDKKLYDPSAGMNAGEKFLVGMGGGARRLYLGAKDLLGQGTPEETQELQEWSKSKENLGGWGTAGELTSEVGLTLPIGGAVAQGGKLLTKAVPALEKAAAWGGGRLLNPGLVARGATEGAITSLIPKPEEGSTRLGQAGTGAFFGAAVPAVLGATGKTLKGAWDHFIPTEGGATRRAGRALDKALTKEELEAAEVAIRNRGAQRIPQTTAAVADSARLGELEAGARGRNLVRFDVHDAKVADETWKRVLDDTSSTVSPERFAEKAARVDQVGRRVLDTYRVDDGARNVLKNELHSILDSNEITANPAKKQAIQRVLGMLEAPNLSVRGLREVYDQLGKIPGDATSSARESLKYAGDSLSDGVFSKMDDVVNRLKTSGEEAGAARRIKETFQSREGIALTTPTFKTPQGDTIPKVTGGPLRKALAKEEGIIDPVRRGDIEALSEELRRHELYMPAADVGGSKADLGSIKGPLTRAVSVSPFWKMRPLIEATIGRADVNTQRVIDEALLDPDKFLKIVEAKKAAGRPLAKWEEVVSNVFATGGIRAGALSQGE